MMNWDKKDLSDLALAVRLLENPGFVSRLCAHIGAPIEIALDCLPTRLKNGLGAAVNHSLSKAMNLAVGSMGEGSSVPSRWMQKALATAAGAASGAFGGPALLVELPFTTCLMLRSIAGIAQSKGEDIAAPSTRVACMEVFALGGPASSMGYFAMRQVLAAEAERVIQLLIVGRVGDDLTPVLLRLIETIASRFSVVVGEKAAAQFVPVIGAVGGATVNYLFMTHFQEMATGHFTVRRLERIYGRSEVLERYQAMKLTRARTGQHVPQRIGMR